MSLRGPVRVRLDAKGHPRIRRALEPGMLARFEQRPEIDRRPTFDDAVGPLEHLEVRRGWGAWTVIGCALAGFGLWALARLLAAVGR